MLLYSIVSNILSMASLVGLAVAWSEKFRGVSIKSVPTAIVLSVNLNVAIREGVFIGSGRSIEERELLNDKLDRKTGDGARSNSWLFHISSFAL